MAQSERDEEAGHDGDESKQVVLAADAAHPIEELAAVEDADSVQEHHQTDQTDRAGDLRLGCDRTEKQPDEEHCTDAQGEAQDTELPDGVAQSDREKEGED